MATYHLSENATYFKNLDSIRFVAAFIVVLSHIVSPIYQYIQLPHYITRIFYTLSYGGTGVSVFFVLSGFLITGLLIREKITTGKIKLLNFYIRRSLRIWPLYFAVILFAFVIYPFLKTSLKLNQPLATNVWYHLGFLANFDVLHVRKFHTGADAMSQNVNWSISVEEQFYIFWPLLFVLFPRKRWTLSIVILLALAIIFRLLNNDNFDILYFHTIAVLPDMAIGGLFAVLITSFPSFLNFIQGQSDGHQIITLLLLFALLYFSPQLATPGYMPALHRLVVDVIVAYIISVQARGTHLNRVKGARWKFASKWGKYTYGIYLLHPIALLIANTGYRLAGITMPEIYALLIQIGLSVPLTFVLSYFSYHYFEGFFLKLKEKF